MKNPLGCYLVGGAVRDRLLGISSKDLDWVVVGSSPEEMLSQGFKQVGSDFPVFLHPESNQEYALARTERKHGHGYQGFKCNSAPSVTLDEDLLRRDLTINAIAQDANGKLFDPYGGEADIQNRVLRHVSLAFREDPLRILRLARFAARFEHLGFKIADETRQLCVQMVLDGEVEHLTPERVWQETQRALEEKSPSVYFEFLKSIDCLKVLFPELDALFGVPQPEQHHPEIDCGIHAYLSLKQAAQLSDLAEVRFAALVHDCGKALTPEQQWPKHHGHETTGLPAIKAMCKRLKAPKAYQELALLVCEYHTHIHRAFELRSNTVVKVLKSCDAFRRPERFEHILLCSTADARGRTGFEHSAYTQADYFRQALSICNAIDIAEIRNSGFEGKALGDKIDQVRASRIKSQLKGKDTYHADH